MNFLFDLIVYLCFAKMLCWFSSKKIQRLKTLGQINCSTWLSLLWTIFLFLSIVTIDTTRQFISIAKGDFVIDDEDDMYYFTV